MNFFLNTLTEHGDIARIGLLVLSMAALHWIEPITTRLSPSHHRRHAGLNAWFVLTAAPVQFILAYAFNLTFHWTASHHFGLLYQLPSQSKWLWFIVGFLLMDLAEYVYHVLMHKAKVLWRFHVVHHSDTHVDVTSVLREHPGETCIRLTFTLCWVWLLGTPFWLLLVRQLIQIVSNVAAHAHLRLPEKLDSVLSWFLVTPNVHHVHHHDKQPYTDTNYGDVLSIWDRLFGTYASLDSSKVRFGIDVMAVDPATNDIRLLLAAPFISPDSSITPSLIMDSALSEGYLDDAPEPSVMA